MLVSSAQRSHPRKHPPHANSHTACGSAPAAQASLLYAFPFPCAPCTSVATAPALSLTPRLSPTPPFTHPFAQVVGDNTPAIQTVLACDVERTRLLAEEAEIISQLGGGGAQDGSSGGGAGSGAAAAAAAAAGAAVRPFGWRAVELLLTRTTAVPSICYPGGH